MLSQNAEMPLIGECSDEENSREQMGTQRSGGSRVDNASEMSGVAQNLQQFIQNVTSLDLRRVNLSATRTESRETDPEVISHLPYKRPGSAARGPLDSDRSGSQGARQGKQVRFNIRDSLKNIMNASETASDQENSHVVANQAQKPRKLTNSKKVRPEARLKFVRRPPSQENRSSNSRERSPSNVRAGSRDPSCETNRTSDSQKPRKVRVSQQSKQLALKYKLNADEMKRKKYGLETPSFYDMVVLSNYQSGAHIKREESRETPNFSAAISKREHLSVQESQTSSLEDALPLPETTPEPLQAPYSMNSEDTVHEVFENINYQERSQSSQGEKQIGTIVRNTGNVHRRAESSSDSRQLAGTIRRQRSPSITLDLSSVGRRPSQASQPSSFIKAGSIVRNQSQQVLSPSQQYQSQPSSGLIDVSKQQNFHYLQTSPGKSNQSFTYIANMDSSRLVPESPSQQSALIDMTKHVYGTLWTLLSGDLRVVRANLKHIQGQSNHLRNELLMKLSRPFDTRVKLSILRGTLPIIIMGTLHTESLAYVEAKERRDQRCLEYTESLGKWRRCPGNQLEQLKSELLKDIVSRLNQKLALAVLRLRVALKKLMILHFETYYQEYIANILKQRAIGQMRAYVHKRQQDKEYLEGVTRVLTELRVRTILRVWSRIRETRESREALEAEATNKVLVRKCSIVFSAWQSQVQDKRLKDIRMAMVDAYRKWRLRPFLFVKWAHATKQHNKIKRKALKMLGNSGVTSSFRHEESRSLECLIEKLKKQFSLSIQDHVQELATYIKPRTVSKPYLKRPLKRVFSSGETRSKKVIDEMPISLGDVRKCEVNLDLKYQIHQALVQVQNHSQPRSLSAAKHYISDGYRPSSTNSQYRTNRLASFDHPQGRGRSAVPNRLFQMLDNKRQKDKCQIANGSFSLQAELRKKAQETFSLVESLQQVTLAQHLRTSLIANATDVLNKEEFKEGIADYIQYGLASENSRLAFQRMHQTKQASILFVQWRKRYLRKELKKQLSDIHTLSTGKQAIIEWQRLIQQRCLWALDFHRTKALRKFYNIFNVWAKHARQENYLLEKKVRLFRKKVCFDGWTRYLSNQGHVLMDIIKAQSHYNQLLLSKSLISIFRHHLECLRVKNFRSYHIYRRFFKLKWTKAFNRKRALRAIMTKRITAAEQGERGKYAREFSLKKHSLQVWRERVDDKVVEILTLQANTHYRQTMTAKTFIHLKKLASLAVGMRRLHRMLCCKRLGPAFLAIANESEALMSSEAHYRRYRVSFQVTRVFNSWKEHVIHVKLARMLRQRRVLHKWYSYMYERTYQAPARQRERKVLRQAVQAWRGLVQKEWNEKRSDIMSRQFCAVRRQRTLKIVFLKMLENLLVSKKERLLQKSIFEFRTDNLCTKAFKILKRRWLKRKKRRLLNLVAQDFSASIRERRDTQLKESLISSTNDLEMNRLREMHVFEDPRKLFLFRVVNSWKMFVQDKVRRDTVVERFQLFKRRMTSLRCFLAWRSIARYEQSSMSSQIQYQQSKEIAPSQKHETRPTTTVVRFAGGDSLQDHALIDTRTFLFNQGHSVHSSQDLAHERVSATFGQRSISSNNEFKGTSSLFDELDGIFKKNRQWLDDQREREEFLKEMASHYNTKLSQELMSSLHYSNDVSLGSRR